MLNKTEKPSCTQDNTANSILQNVMISQTLAVTRSLSKTAGLLQSLMTHAMSAVSLILFFYRTYVFLRKKQKTHCPDKLKRFYQLFSLNFASIKSCEKSWAIFGEYLISGFLGIYNAFLLNFWGFLDFARIKFRDSFQIAKLAKFSTREIKWE